MHQFAVCHPLFGRCLGKGLVTTQRFGFCAQTSLVSENCCEHVTDGVVQLEPLQHSVLPVPANSTSGIAKGQLH